MHSTDQRYKDRQIVRFFYERQNCRVYDINIYSYYYTIGKSKPKQNVIEQRYRYSAEAKR